MSGQACRAARANRGRGGAARSSRGADCAPIGTHEDGDRLIAGAAMFAAEQLAPLPDRWRHTASVGRLAEQVARVLPREQRPLLVAAALLHDVGYAPALVETGFHPLDGARALEGLAPARVVALVAHHTGAHYEAALHGLSEQLTRYPREASLLAEALSYCDLRTGPLGQSLSIEERWADIERRYGPEHMVVRTLRIAEPELRAAVRRVELAIERHRTRSVFAGNPEAAAVPELAQPSPAACHCADAESGFPESRPAQPDEPAGGFVDRWCALPAGVRPALPPTTVGGPATKGQVARDQDEGQPRAGRLARDDA